VRDWGAFVRFLELAAVKHTEHPTLSDARHVLDFLAEQGPRARQGFVICRTPHPLKLQDRVTALPWASL
jgi:hypothetical protein